MSVAGNAQSHVETLGGGSARAEVGMGRPHKGEATLWGGPLGANKALTSTDTERKAQRKGLGRETPASGASPPGN